MIFYTSLFFLPFLGLNFKKGLFEGLKSIRKSGVYKEIFEPVRTFPDKYEEFKSLFSSEFSP